MSDFRKVGIGYREGTNFYFKFLTSTVYDQPLVVSLKRLHDLVNDATKDVPVYERNPQKQIVPEVTGNDWIVRKVGLINMSTSGKSLVLTLGEYRTYLNRIHTLDTISRKRHHVDITERVSPNG